MLWLAIGGWDYEGEDAQSVRVFATKAAALEYAEKIRIRNASRTEYNHAVVMLLSELYFDSSEALQAEAYPQQRLTSEDA